MYLYYIFIFLWMFPTKATCELTIEDWLGEVLTSGTVRNQWNAIELLQYPLLFDIVGWAKIYKKQWKQLRPAKILIKLSLDVSLKCVCYVCLFRGFRPTWEFFTHLKSHHCQWKAVNFDLYSALMVIEQWGFFRVPMWHGASVYKGDQWGPVTLTPTSVMSSVWQWSCHYLI